MLPARYDDDDDSNNSDLATECTWKLIVDILIKFSIQILYLYFGLLSAVPNEKIQNTKKSIEKYLKKYIL